MSREEMLYVVCVRRGAAIGAGVYVRPHDCLYAAAAMLSVLAAGTTVWVILDVPGCRVEWKAVATGKACAWIVQQQAAEAAAHDRARA